MPDNTISSINKLQTQQTEIKKSEPKEKKETEADSIFSAKKPENTTDSDKTSQKDKINELTQQNKTPEEDEKRRQELQERRDQSEAERQAKVDEITQELEQAEAEHEQQRAELQKEIDDKTKELDKLVADEKARIEKENKDQIPGIQQQFDKATRRIQKINDKLKDSDNMTKARVDRLKDERKALKNDRSGYRKDIQDLQQPVTVNPNDVPRGGTLQDEIRVANDRLDSQDDSHNRHIRRLESRLSNYSLSDEAYARLSGGEVAETNPAYTDAYNAHIEKFKLPLKGIEFFA